MQGYQYITYSAQWFYQIHIYTKIKYEEAGTKYSGYGMYNIELQNNWYMVQADHILALVLKFLKPHQINCKLHQNRKTSI